VCRRWAGLLRSCWCLPSRAAGKAVGLALYCRRLCSLPDEMARCLVRVQSDARGRRISLLSKASQHRFVQQRWKKAGTEPSFLPFRRLTSSRTYQVPQAFLLRKKAWGIVRRNSSAACSGLTVTVGQTEEIAAHSCLVPSRGQAVSAFSSVWKPLLAARSRRFEAAICSLAFVFFTGDRGLAERDVVFRRLRDPRLQGFLAAPEQSCAQDALA